MTRQEIISTVEELLLESKCRRSDFDYLQGIYDGETIAYRTILKLLERELFICQ